MDSLFSSFSNERSPGFALSVIKNGRVVERRDYGMASIEFKVPFSHSTVVRIPYSEGREFIAILAALMDAEGLLSLNDSVGKYFPKLPAWSRRVTIQDLLNHSSGFCDEWATLVLTQAEMSNRLDVSQFLELLYSQPDPQVEPGKGYMYSNSDFGLLRLMLEKACGGDLSAFMTRKVFSPLGMVNTKLGTDKEEVVNSHAFSYAEVGRGKYTVWMRDKTSPGGNYWILTNGNDLEKWAFAHADKNSFVQKAVQRLKREARPIPVLKTGTNFVFGQKLKRLGNLDMITHQGVNGYAHLTEVPDSGLAIVCISNNLDPNADKTEAIAKYLLNVKESASVRKKLPDQPVAITVTQLKQYEGVYQWMHAPSFQSAVPRKQFTEMKVIGDSLWMLYSDTETFPLVYVGNGIFKDPDYPVWNAFYKNHPDSVMLATVYLNAAINDTIQWRKVTSAKKNYSKEYLQNLCGTYYSKHLNYYWKIVLNEQNQLVLKRPTIADKIIEPGYDDEFMLPIQFHTNDDSWGWIRFSFSATGKVISLDVKHSRLMHHRFDKIN